MGYPVVHDVQGAQLIWVEWSERPIGRVWPWILTILGVLIVVLGAVLFSPKGSIASGPAFHDWLGWEDRAADRISEPLTLPAQG